MSKLSDATLRYLENAIEVVKAHADDLEPCYLGMIGKHLAPIAKNNSRCSFDAAQLDFDNGYIGELQDAEFEAKLAVNAEVRP